MSLCSIDIVEDLILVCVGCNVMCILGRIAANLADSSDASLPSSPTWLGIQLRAMFLFWNLSACNWCIMLVMSLMFC